MLFIDEFPKPPGNQGGKKTIPKKEFNGKFTLVNISYQ